MNLKKNGKTLLALLLAVTMVLALAACGSDSPDPVPSSSEESSSSSESSGSSSSDSSSDSSSSSDPNKPTPAEIQKKMLTGMVNHYAKNEDTVGWLHVPGTTIDEVVVQAIGDSSNDYYMRRTNLKQENFDGCYFVDFRGHMGSRDKLSKNTVIYGHSMDDNPESNRFSQLKKYLDIDFAKENGTIYFSTPDSEMLWQVFAVFYTDTSFNYIEPNLSNADFMNVVNSARKRSQFNFDVDVTANDKILTLSTCTYKFTASYPNNYRYVVMAKLLPVGATPGEVKVEVNPAPQAPAGAK